MKSFFEEYGFVILAAIIVILLIAMATPIGTLIRSNISHIVESFGEKTTQKLDYTMREYQAKDIIEVEGHKLTIMKNLGNDKYLVLDEKQTYNKGFNKCDEYKDGKCVKGRNEYANSIVDKWLEETYYNNLPTSIKNAIVSQNISQNFYNSGLKNEQNSDYKYQQHNSCPADQTRCWTVPVNGETNYLWGNDNWKKYNAVSGKSGAYAFNENLKRTENIGERKVFLPSADELRNIVNYNDSKEMEDFLQTKTNPYYMWLRDAYGSYALCAGCSYRSLNSAHVWLSGISVRPAFVLDLSKVSYSAK